MAVFNMGGLNPGVWFDYDGGRVCVRAHPQDVIKEIQEKCVKRWTEYKPIRKHGPVQPIQRTEADEKKLDQMLWDYCVVDWEGFFDIDGEPIPCTLENKVALMGGDPKFYEFVDGCLEKITAYDEKHAEDIEKNS